MLTASFYYEAIKTLSREQNPIKLLPDKDPNTGPRNHSGANEQAPISICYVLRQSEGTSVADAQCAKGKEYYCQQYCRILVEAPYLLPAQYNVLGHE